MEITVSKGISTILDHNYLNLQKINFLLSKCRKVSEV